MASSSTPNQSNFQTNQNFDIDLQEVYNDFIQEIDANRSIVNLQVNTTVLNSFNIKTIASLANQLKIESTPQESRAHAFYRLIGLPVVGGSGQFYNPGLDNISGNKTIYLSDKITIANSISSDFKALSLQRENYPNGWLALFNQQPVTITSSALSLSSSTQTRQFSVPTTVTDPTSFVPGNQKYTPSLNSIVGKYHTQLTAYVDANGNKPNSSTLAATRYHFIQPFQVDPRIDFTVNPSSRRVAVPFVPSKKNLLVAENVFVKRPLIEKVIRDRFTSTQGAVVSSSQQQIIDYILNVPTVKQDNLISQMVNDIYNTGEQALFEKYLFMIQAMCTKLVKAQLDIQLVQSRYYWAPAPAVNGPEGGSSVQGIIISSTMPTNLITIADNSIIQQSLRQSANKFDTSSSEADGTPDLGGFAFDGGTKFFDLTFDDDTSTALGDINNTQLTNLNKKRDHDLSTANTALQDIEVIMGEWSGLGLCDIIAVMASLYTMDQNKLLGFLDDDALGRCSNQLGIDTSSAGDVSDALQALVTSVNNYYHLMDDIYKNLATSNGLTPSQ